MKRALPPSNVDQGYVLRRLIRRAIRFASKLGIQEGKLYVVAQKGDLPSMAAYTLNSLQIRERILSELSLEEERFQKDDKAGP